MTWSLARADEHATLVETLFALEADTIRAASPGPKYDKCWSCRERDDNGACRVELLYLLRARRDSLSTTQLMQLFAVSLSRVHRSKIDVWHLLCNRGTDRPISSMPKMPTSTSSS